MKRFIKSIVNESANASTLYENTNTGLKKEYLKINVNKINEIFKKTNGFKGSFATGYPFDILDKNFNGNLPIIKEQIRYNEELISHSMGIEHKVWNCSECLKMNYESMPDLKQICKPCPNMNDELKPRKVINRLPDLDMWILCDDYDIESVAKQLTELFHKENMRTSDIDPLATIRDVRIIASDLSHDVMPTVYLPLDVHIISEKTIEDLLIMVNEKLISSFEEQKVPYLPIHPLSYRKIWQKDDVAYNFIFDYLSSFTLFESSKLIEHLLKTSRKTTTENFDYDELYKLLICSCGDAHKRRYENEELQNSFERKMIKWKKL